MINQKEIVVTCAVIYNSGKIFLARRKPGKSLEGYWEFPGGKLEDGEDLQSCLKREIMEEFDVKIETQQYLGVSEFSYPDFGIVLHAFICRAGSTEFSPNDHDQVAWVSSEELSDFKLAPADIPLIDKIVEYEQTNNLWRN